jgi:hypothetical protein
VPGTLKPDLHHLHFSQSYQDVLLKGCPLFSKDEFGHPREKGECDYVIILDAAAYEVTKPVFLFREFNSWKTLGHRDMVH